MTFLHLCVCFLEHCTVPGLELKQNTLKTKRNRFQLLTKFLKANDLTGIEPEQFDARTALKFIDWGKRNKYKESTINSALKFVKGAHIYNYLYNNAPTSPLQGFRMKTNPVDPGADLETWEVNKIVATRFTPGVQRAADLFVFQCYTGLAYVDTQNFSYTAHTAAYQGMQFIDMKRIKSGISATIPLLAVPIAILQKYDYRLPLMSLKTYNKHLKVIGRRAGLEKVLTSHVGRRTCGNFFLDAGLSIESVSKILGHSSTKQTEKLYAKVKKSRIYREMSSLGLSTTQLNANESNAVSFGTL